LFKRFSVAAIFLGCCTVVGAQSYLPDGKGKEILDNYCQECHGLDPVIQQSLSAVEWRRAIARMVKKGASLKAADIDTLVEYLTAYFGPDSAAVRIDINHATASEIEKALGCRTGEAEALVRYRKSHGRFKSWSDLLKARLVDAQKLAAKRGSITF
jgi:competence ComEA-like helix-hairpin-helix protein